MVKYIVEFYKGKDVEVEMNIGLCGIKVMIDLGKFGKILVICVDFDVLFIIEDIGLFFVL